MLYDIQNSLDAITDQLEKVVEALRYIGENL